MKKLLLFSSLLVLFLVGVTPASANFLPSSQHSVDNGEIRWGTYHGSTKWTSARNNAISKWNAGGPIKILGDTVTTIEDLSFTDYSASDGVLGSWTQYTGADRIRFNNNYFNSMQACERNKTALHELGHALNLGHNSVSGSVMRSGVICQSSLGSHDKKLVNQRW